MLKRRVANIFIKRNSLSDESRGTSTQTIVNHMESEEERSIVESDKRDSIHSDWSDLIPVNEEVEYKVYKIRKGPDAVDVATTSAASTAEATIILSAPPVKKTVKNIVLVLYTPRPNDLGSWQIKSPYATSTVASPHPACRQVNWEEKEEEGELVYEPHSPYYSPVHPPEFYEDE